MPTEDMLALLFLPTELLLLIFSFLPIKDLSHLSQCSKLSLTLYNGDRVWLERIRDEFKIPVDVTLRYLKNNPPSNQIDLTPKIIYKTMLSKKMLLKQQKRFHQFTAAPQFPLLLLAVYMDDPVYFKHIPMSDIDWWFDLCLTMHCQQIPRILIKDGIIGQSYAVLMNYSIDARHPTINMEFIYKDIAQVAAKKAIDKKLFELAAKIILKFYRNIDESIYQDALKSGDDDLTALVEKFYRNLLYYSLPEINCAAASGNKALFERVINAVNARTDIDKTNVRPDIHTLNWAITSLNITLIKFIIDEFSVIPNQSSFDVSLKTGKMEVVRLVKDNMKERPAINHSTLLKSSEAIFFDYLKDEFLLPISLVIEYILNSRLVDLAFNWINLHKVAVTPRFVTIAACQGLHDATIQLFHMIPVQDRKESDMRIYIEAACYSGNSQLVISLLERYKGSATLKMLENAFLSENLVLVKTIYNLLSDEDKREPLPDTVLLAALENSHTLRHIFHPSNDYSLPINYSLQVLNHPKVSCLVLLKQAKRMIEHVLHAEGDEIPDFNFEDIKQMYNIDAMLFYYWVDYILIHREKLTREAFITLMKWDLVWKSPSPITQFMFADLLLNDENFTGVINKQTAHANSMMKYSFSMLEYDSDLKDQFEQLFTSEENTTSLRM